MPTLKELFTILDYEKTMTPVVLDELFDQGVITSAKYWTSTPSPGSPGLAFTINLNKVQMLASSTGDTYQSLCVTSATPFD